MNVLRALSLAAVLLAAIPATASASKTMESTFQDDPLLLGPEDNVEQTLDELQAVGADRLRLSVFWAAVAPAAGEEQRPNFDATNPAAYPAKNWERYDRIVRGAAQRGIKINFNPTSPAPRWATGPSPRADLQKNYKPDPQAFGQFVQALGTRYSGGFMMLPRVDYWSLWNEPNQGAWLSPQSQPDPRNAKRKVEFAPHLYRALAGAAYTGLNNSGHGQDTIIIGETAPKGAEKSLDISRPLDPLRFIRQMYCLDDNLQVLKGTNAEVRGCPATGFVEANPVLFKSTGYAHHPYELLRAPTDDPGSPDFVTIANLGDLQRELRRIYARYGQKTPDPFGVPMYLTEFGYQTPPDPFGVSFALQAAYINQSEYIAYNNRLVRTMSQFLLNDDAAVPGATNARDKYLTFQSGLRSVEGKDKLARKAYITPIHVVGRAVRRGRSSRVWGMLRPAGGPTPKTVQIQFRQRGSKRWRKLASVKAKPPSFYLGTRVKVPRTGSVRIFWRDGGRPTASRPVSVRVR